MRYRVRARPLRGLAGRFSLPLGSHGISTRTVLKTRRTSPRRKPTKTVTSAGSCFADVAPAPHGRVAPDPRLSPSVCAAAWPPAIAATRAGSRVFGSTAASNAAPGISARNLCADRCATPVVYLWSRYRLPMYARRVPWEVVAPLGAARGGSLHPPRALTHSRSDLTPSPFAIPYRLVAQLPLPAIGENRWRNTEGNDGKRRQKPAPCATQNQAEPKETGKETVQIRSGLKENNEEDGQVNPCSWKVWEGYEGRSGRRVLTANWS